MPRPVFTAPDRSCRLIAPVAVRIVASLLLVAGIAQVPAAAAPSEAKRPFLEPEPPAASLPRAARAPARGDTIDFGFYEIRSDGLAYAVRDGLWTFDHGAPDPLEGWTSIDRTDNGGEFWRRMTQEIWMDEGNDLPWPHMNGSPGIALCGLSKPRADTLAWVAGAGYGDLWRQRLTSPALTYDGSGSVDLAFNYFNDTESMYDYTRLYLVVGTTRTLLNSPGFSDRIGIDEAGVILPQTFAHVITNAEFGGGPNPEFQLQFEFTSDISFSDEDGNFATSYGACGFDHLLVAGANLVPPVSSIYEFDTSLEGWTPSRCPAVGSFLGVAPLSQYSVADACACALSGHVLEMHDESLHHPGGPAPQFEIAVSPICDRRADIGDPAYLQYGRISAEWAQYGELPQAGGILYRAGWSYFPYANPDLPGLEQWSPRVVSNTGGFIAWLDCYELSSVGTDEGVPPTAEKVRFLYEIVSSCAAFGIPDCGQQTSFAPVIDNIRIRNTSSPQSPALVLRSGSRFQDGFGQLGSVLDVGDAGNADIWRNMRWASGPPVRLGDSLLVSGPTPTSSTRWEARLWLRLKRTGPGQSGNAVYNQWKNALHAAKGIDFFTGPNPGFTWGYMDSVETGTSVDNRSFCSQFRDGPSPGGQYLPADPNHNWGGGGEQAEGNEILPDLCFTPGTKIEYFMTANFICAPLGYSYLPDTLGRNYWEFEILPAYRVDGGASRFPCVLYVNGARNESDQEYIEAALWKIHSGSAGPIPDPAPWDRYDYYAADRDDCGSFFRLAGGNNGATLQQLLGYKTVLFDTGARTLSGPGKTVPDDWYGLAQWLSSSACTSNNRIQGLYLSGSDIAGDIDRAYPALLNDDLGAGLACGYRIYYDDPGCPPGETANDENFCVRLQPVAGAVAPMDLPVDLYDNGCPGARFTVLGTTGSGQGSLRYRNVSAPDSASFAQVVNDQLASGLRYRTVLSGFDPRHVAARGPTTECPIDSNSVVTGIAAQLDAALGWLLCGDFAGYPLCDTRRATAARGRSRIAAPRGSRNRRRTSMFPDSIPAGRTLPMRAPRSGSLSSGTDGYGFSSATWPGAR